MTIDAASRGAAAVAQRCWRDELPRLRRLTDPEMDDAIQAYRERRPHLTDHRQLVTAIIADLARAKGGDVPANGPLQAMMDLAPQQLPVWARDETLLRRGQDVFNDHGVTMGAVLCFASLPIAYASADGAKALARTSDLATKNLTRRIGETGRMMVDVLGTRGFESLEPGGRGYATAFGVRVLHACVRSLLADPQVQPPWPNKHFGPPLNQEILLGTLMDFTIVTWTAMKQLGDELTEDECAAHLYVWSIIGHLMGLEACKDGPLQLADVHDLTPLLARHFRETEDGRRLMDGLLTQFESFMPLGWRKLPRSLVHWLFEGAKFGIDRVPQLLGVPPAAWWSVPLFAALRAARTSRVLAPVEPLLTWSMRRTGRLVLLGFVDGFAPGVPPWQIPESLARSLGYRPIGMRHEARAVRHYVRKNLRTALRTLPFTQVE